jgi:hypothetical protein
MTVEELAEIDAGAARAGLDRSSFMRSASLIHARQAMTKTKRQKPRK